MLLSLTITISFIIIYIIIIKLLKINNIIAVFLFIYLIKNKRNRIRLDDYFKTGYINNKEIKLNNNNFFIIKKENVINNEKILVDNKNIVYYPGYEKNLIDTGDIILFIFYKTTFIRSIIQYFINGKITHCGFISHFEIDFSNSRKFNIPKDYYLVDPIVIQSGAALDKKMYLKVFDMSYYDMLDNKKMKNCNLHHFKYKKFDTIREKFFNIVLKYNFTKYDLSTYIDTVSSNIIKIFYDYYKNITNQSYFKNRNSYYNFLLKYLYSSNKKPLSIKKLNNIDLLIAMNFKYLQLAKIKEEKEDIMEILNNLTKYKKTIKSERGFVCSSFVYYIYKKLGIDLSKNNSFNIDDMKFNIFFTPEKLESLYTDTRFKYMCTIRS